VAHTGHDPRSHRGHVMARPGSAGAPPPDEAAAHRPDRAACDVGGGCAGGGRHAGEWAPDSYGALARHGSDEAVGEHTRRRRRRWAQAGAAAVALSFVVLLAASVERGSAAQRSFPAVVLEDAAGGGGGGNTAAPVDKQQKNWYKNADTYCEVFADPTECEKQKVEGMPKYWSDAELRSELWKTMKALAELELRENAMHKEHKAKADEQARLFDLFRQTMGQEVADIHRLQDEMHQRHTAAFKQLVLQVVGIATELKDYTDTQVDQVNGRIDSLQRTHDFDHQRVLTAIADKMNLVNREIEDLHRGSMTAVNGTQQYAEDVEKAMKAGDLRLDAMIQQIEVDVNSLDDKDKTDWNTLSTALQAAEEKQEADRQTLDSKIDTDVSALRTESSDELAAERREIRQQLTEAMAIIAGGVTSLTQNTTERYDNIQRAIDQMIVEQRASNEEQAMNISRIRRAFEQDRDAAYARLDAADVRLDKAFRDLAAAKGRLASEAAADYTLLQNEIDRGVGLRDKEAAALRSWAKDETAAIKASLTTTQNLLNAERDRLQAQRNADMGLPLNFGHPRKGSMPDKINQDVKRWDESVNAQMDADNIAIHATLTARVQEATAALAPLKGTIKTDNGNLQVQYDGMKALQVQNNALQQKAIDDLQRDASVEKALSEARLAALDGNMEAVKKRLATVKSEITDIQDKDRADIRARVASGFAATKTRLEGDLSKDHIALWDKLNGGIGALRTTYDQIRDVVEKRESGIVKFSDDIAVDQRHQKTKENLEMDDIDRTQKQHEREFDTTTDGLLTILGTVKARLTTELSRVGMERDHDDAQMRSNIDSQNNITETDAQSKLAVVENKMKAELSSLFAQLKTTFNAQKLKEETDFQELVADLTAWETSQKAENQRQRAWLQTIADASKNSASDIGSQTSTLRKVLKMEDKRLTASGTKLEKEQRATAHAINTSLHADMASLKADAFGFITRTRLGVKSEIDGGAGDLEARVVSLQAAAKDTETTIQNAIDAMRDKIEARRAARAAEVEDIKKKAAEEKAKMEALSDGLLRRIEKGKANVGEELKKSAQERDTLAANAKAFITGKVQVATSNFSAQVAAEEAQDVAMVQNEVDQWTAELKANQEASVTEAAAVDVKLRQLQASNSQKSSI